MLVFILFDRKQRLCCAHMIWLCSPSAEMQDEQRFVLHFVWLAGPRLSAGSPAEDTAIPRQQVEPLASETTLPSVHTAEKPQKSLRSQSAAAGTHGHQAARGKE